MDLTRAASIREKYRMYLMSGDVRGSSRSKAVEEIEEKYQQAKPGLMAGELSVSDVAREYGITHRSIRLRLNRDGIIAAQGKPGPKKS